MVIDLTISDKECNFQNCINNDNGKCTNIKDRLDCLVMALAILGIGEVDVGEESQKRF